MLQNLTRYRLVDSLPLAFQLDAEKHAMHELPKESCGLVVSGKYFACHNVSEQPEKDFIICPNDYMAAAMSGKLEAVVHSHPTGGPPSEFDVGACTATRLPWYVLSVPEKQWSIIDP
jgi:proteasome lid subunit RPN8/RPN11